MTVHLVICGEPMRGDDAAAFRAFERIDVPAGVRVRSTRSPAPDDFLDIAQGDTCVVADAVRGVPPGETVVVALEAIVAGVDAGAVSTHTLPLRDSLQIACAVLGFTPKGVFVGMGGHEFGLGAGMSTPAREGIDFFAAAIARALSAVVEAP